MVERKKKDHLPIYGIGPALCYPMAMLSAVGIWLSVKGIIPMKIENKPISIAMRMIL